MGNTRLRPGVPVGTKDASKDQQYVLTGFLQVGVLLLRLKGTSTATLDFSKIGINISQLNGRNIGTISNLSGLSYYIEAEKAGFGHSVISNPVGGGAVDCIFRITFGTPGYPVPLGLKSDEDLVIELDKVPTFAGTWSLKVRELPGVMPWLQDLSDRTLTYTGNDEVKLPNNLAGFMLTPAYGAGATDPTEITIYQGATRMDEGSYVSLVEEQAGRWNWDGGSTPRNLFYFFTGDLWNPPHVIEAVHDSLTLSIDGAAGFADLTMFTVRPEFSLLQDSTAQMADIARRETERVHSNPSVEAVMKPIIAPVETAEGRTPVANLIAPRSRRAMDLF